MKVRKIVLKSLVPFFVLSVSVITPLDISCKNLELVQAAQASSVNYNELLLEKWDQLNSPDFVFAAKAVIDEVEDNVRSFDPEYSRKLLEADHFQDPRQASSVVDTRVYSSLQHQTKSKYLIRNLKNGFLEPRAGSGDLYFRKGVYLELHLQSNPKPFAWGDVELHFDYRLLDRKDYYVSTSWSYGDYVPDSASPAVSMGRVNFLIEQVLPTTEQNEFVFVSKVSLSALTTIVVPEGTKEALIQKLLQEKVQCPVVHSSWDQLITEQKMPAGLTHSTQF